MKNNQNDSKTTSSITTIIDSRKKAVERAAEYLQNNNSEKASRMFDIVNCLESAIYTTPPASVSDVVEQLRIYRNNLRQEHINSKCQATQYEKAVIAMLGNVIGFLANTTCKCIS